uniref:DUF2963 domain-containing protein n=1 Tax=Candidatus Phytoplasma sp. AldY-WA1 TaxID=2852100 RepID=UPI00254F2474
SSGTPPTPVQSPTTITPAASETPTQAPTPQPAKTNEEASSNEEAITSLVDELVTIKEDVDKLKATKPQPTNNNEISSLNKQNKEQKEKIDKLEKRLSTVELKNIQNPSISQTPTQSNNEDFPKTDLTKMPSFDKLIGFKEEREAADRFLNFLKSIGNFPNIGEVKIPTGILLHGVAGTGKTTFAQALAKEANLPFFNTSASQFSKGVVGEAPQMVRDLFATARKEAQRSGGAIIFIDECEEIFKDLTDNQSKNTADTVNIINEFKAQMTSYENDPKKPVFLMGATNHINKIDEAIKSRFSYMIEIKPGDFEDRKKMLEFLIKKRQNPYSDDAKDYLLNVVNRALDELPPYKRANRILTGVLDEAVSTLVLESNKTTPPRTQINIDDIKTAYRLRVDKDTGILDIIDNHRKQQPASTTPTTGTTKTGSQTPPVQPASATPPTGTTTTGSQTPPVQPASTTSPTGTTATGIQTTRTVTPQTTKKIIFQKDNETIKTIEERDKSEKLVKKTRYLYDNKNIFYIKEYNENEKLIKRTTYFPNGQTILSIAEYNENGQLTKAIEYYPDGQTIKRNVEFDKNGKIVKQTKYNPNSKIIGKIYNYDKNEKLVKKTFYQPDGQIINCIKEFDENEKLIKETIYQKDGVTIKFINEYNNNKKTKETKYYPNGLAIDYINEYDENEKLTKKTDY